MECGEATSRRFEQPLGSSKETGGDSLSLDVLHYVAQKRRQVAALHTERVPDPENLTANVTPLPHYWYI
jgi:hypothetical protein